jgi:hypothetical protein
MLSGGRLRNRRPGRGFSLVNRVIGVGVMYHDGGVDGRSFMITLVYRVEEGDE